MPTLMEQHIEQGRQPCCTRQQAAAVLEGLRAQYQALSRCERGAIRAYFLTQSDQQFSIEGEE